MRRRPRVLFVWELGANWGHASKVAETAAALAGHAEIVIAAREPAAVAAIAPDLAAVTRPAPFAPPPPPPPAGPAGPVVSYADALRFCGWDDPARLAALLRAWRALYAEAAPDLIVTQAAPTALLAARGGPARLAALGSGYDMPALAAPMPAFLPDRCAPPAAAAAEAAALAVADAALAALGEGPLPAIRALFDGALGCLATFERIDHWRPRAAIDPFHPPYLGQLVSVATGTALAWAGDGRPRVLAYLRPGAACFAPAAAALAAGGRGWDVALAAPGLPADPLRRLRAAGLRAVDGPLRLDALLPQADLVISHGSNGVAAAALMAGAPQLALPTQTEQMMIGRALAAQRAGLCVAGAIDAAALGRLIARALAAPALRAGAAAAAADIAATAPTDPAGAVAARLLAAL